MAFLQALSGLAPIAGKVLAGVSSLLMGKNLIFDKNSNVSDKLRAAVSWTPIYSLKQGAITALKTTLRITGAPPLVQGTTYQWDRGSADAAPGSYKIVDADCNCPGSPSNDRMPTEFAAAVVLKQGVAAAEFSGTGVDVPRLGSLPINSNSQELLSDNILMTAGNVWGDAAEMLDGVRGHLNGYDDHVYFEGGFTGTDYPANKTQTVNDGDLLLVAYIATDAPPTINWPNQWTPSDSTLCFGNISGNVSIVLQTQ